MIANSPDAGYRGTPEGRYDQTGGKGENLDTPQQAQLRQKLTELCATITSQSEKRINVEDFSALVRQAEKIGELDFFWATFGEINSHLATVIFASIKNESKFAIKKHDTVGSIQAGAKK